MKGAILGVLKALKYFKKTDSQIREVLVNDLVMTHGVENHMTY